MNVPTKPRIAITTGDPAGVGPELCLKVAIDPRVNKICEPVIFGDSFVLAKVRDALQLEKIEIVSLPDLNQVQDLPKPSSTGSQSVHVIGCGGPRASQNINDIVAGEISAVTGQLSFDAVNRAIDDALAGNVAGVVTGPINKEAWNLAGIKYPGHTELFAERSNTDSFCMMMTSPQISCSLVTCHVGISAVPAMITTERILEVIRLTHTALENLRGQEPKIVVLGLNPHAGENGLFGNEETALIEPAISAAREIGINVDGPLPPDTAFVPNKLEETDAHVCMYHDQGLIPFKALAFDTGVNVTLGLPIVRTSVDHGTALDIAWQGTADTSSMFSAIRLATQLANGRVESNPGSQRV